MMFEQQVMNRRTPHQNEIMPLALKLFLFIGVLRERVMQILDTGGKVDKPWLALVRKVRPVFAG
jgi:hypothetical protein